jgi:hypothetical protein
MKFAAGMLTVTILIAIATGMDPLIGAKIWCAVTQSERCF